MEFDLFSLAAIGITSLGTVADFFGLPEDAWILIFAGLLLAFIGWFAVWAYRRTGRLRLWGFLPLRWLVVLVSVPVAVLPAVVLLFFVVCAFQSCWGP